MGLLCAEKNVGNRRKRTFRNSGMPVRRTKRRKYKYKCTFRRYWTLVRRTQRRKYQRVYFHNLTLLVSPWTLLGSKQTPVVKVVSRIYGLFRSQEPLELTFRALGVHVAALWVSLGAYRGGMGNHVALLGGALVPKSRVQPFQRRPRWQSKNLKKLQCF